MPKTFLQKIKNKLSIKKSGKLVRQGDPLTKDQVQINLLGLGITVERTTNLEVPSELSVILPRVEYRNNCTSGDPPLCNSEIIYNSLTIVIAPRHPLAGPPPADAVQQNKRSSLNSR